LIIKILLDKANNIFLSKSFDLKDATIDNDSSLLLKSDDVEVKITPEDAFQLMFLASKVFVQWSTNIFRGGNNEPGTTTTK